MPTGPSHHALQREIDRLKAEVSFRDSIIANQHARIADQERMNVALRAEIKQVGAKLEETRSHPTDSKVMMSVILCVSQAPVASL